MRASLDIQIVSHGTPELVAQLLADLRGVPARILLLENRPGVAHDLPAGVDMPVPPQARELGFAENHGLLAACGRGEFIALLNPDLRVRGEVFDALLAYFDDPSVAVVAPRVHAPSGRLEDNARRVLTPWRLLRDRLARRRCKTDYPREDEVCEPDWVAGLFMIVRRAVFERLGGLDRAYRLYCEDMEFCLRVWLSGHRVLCVPCRGVVHDARRASLSSLRHLGWHLASLARFWCSASFRRFLLSRGGARC